METACRRGGALALAPDDLDPEQCLIRLREKGETIRWQPVSPTLMRHLLAHGESRGGLGNGQRLLRYANGRPITKKRYEYLWRRLGEHLPWADTLQVSMYWIRHTILTWVERNFGFAVAEAYAGHEDNGRGARAMGAMATYVRAGLPEVATALAALTGEPHPLAINDAMHPATVTRISGDSVGQEPAPFSWLRPSVRTFGALSRRKGENCMRIQPMSGTSGMARRSAPAGLHLAVELSACTAMASWLPCAPARYAPGKLRPVRPVGICSERSAAATW
jgi:hypothetical protein